MKAAENYRRIIDEDDAETAPIPMRHGTNQSDSGGLLEFRQS
jgi:hypothetical protein